MAEIEKKLLAMAWWLREENKMMKKITISCLIIVLSFISLSFSAQAATLKDAKEAVLSGKGKVVHPRLYRELTDEEKEARKDWPDKLEKTNREMTKEEADEYFSYIDKYQSENKTNIVPSEAYDYIQYIAEKLEASNKTEITDALRSEAEKYVNKNKQKDLKTEKKELVKEKEGKKMKHKKTSLWAKIFSFKWF